jgi:hypothetical protein
MPTDAQIAARIERIEEQRDGDLRNLLSQDWGRRLVYWLVFDVGGMCAGSFDETKRDGNNTGMFTAYNEGRRAAGIDIFNRVESASRGSVLEAWKEQSLAVAQAALVTEHNDE